MTATETRGTPAYAASVESYGRECASRLAALPPRIRVIRDVAYGIDARQRMDIYLPADGGVKDRPVLLFMHGGGWTSGNKEGCGFMAPPFVDGGAILVSVGYRLIPSVSYPDPVKDCVRALRWIEQRAADYGGSSKRLFVGGHSAGGQIAALMSLHPEWLRQAGCAPDAIKATFCLSTTYNRRMVRPELAPGHDQPGPAEAIRPDSPIALAGNARAPFYMGWGTLDDERMERTAGQMIDALTDARCPLVTWQAIPGGNHFSVHLDMDDPDNAWTRLILASMKSDDLVTRSARRAA